MHIYPCQQQKWEKNQSEDLEMDKIKISDAMVLTSAQIRTYKAAFHRSRDESANNDNDADGGGGADARPWERIFFHVWERGSDLSSFVFIFRFEKEGVICGKQLGKLLRNIGQNPSEAEVRVLVMFVS